MGDSAVTALGIGLLASTSPCVLPLYPGFLAYLAAQAERGSRPSSRYLGFAVLAGVLTMMLALGAIIALLAISIGRALTILVPLSDVVLLLVGVALLLGRNPFRRLPGVRLGGTRRPLVEAYLYGLLYGPIALPCCGPLVVAIFAVSMTAGEAVSVLWTFLWFGLGMGVPLLVISLLSPPIQRRLTRTTARNGRALEIAAGVLLVGVAVYDGLGNWESITFLLGSLATRA